MEKRLTFLKLAEIVLEKAQKPLTSVEIWAMAREQKLDKVMGTSGKTPERSIGAQIYVDIRDKKKDSIFSQDSVRPVKFCLRKYSDGQSHFDDEPIMRKSSNSLFNERDLHPLLVKFANADVHFKSYLKTIFHEGSRKGKKGMSEWLHPDLVGVYFPFTDFHESTIDLQEKLSLSSVKLFSFEVKIKLTFENLREAYFQAVSNSSWAHEGYLVTLGIDRNPDLMDELRRLSNAFGIGVIKLDPQNIEQSDILFPSKTNQELDFDTINRLTKKNDDFKTFLKDVCNSIKTKEPVPSKYDVILDSSDFEKYVKEKKISSLI